MKFVLLILLAGWGNPKDNNAPTRWYEGTSKYFKSTSISEIENETDLFCTKPKNAKSYLELKNCKQTKLCLVTLANESNWVYNGTCKELLQEIK